MSLDQYFDNLSGQQAYTCFACPVRTVAQNGLE
jgi:hypothetical protein